jgi:hypothetical protein
MAEGFKSIGPKEPARLLLAVNGEVLATKDVR